MKLEARCRKHGCNLSTSDGREPGLMTADVEGLLEVDFAYSECRVYEKEMEAWEAAGAAGPEPELCSAHWELRFQVL